MNEHIRQPAEQARKYADENRSGSFVKYDPEWFVLYNEKFAELIVRECVDIAQDRAAFDGFPPNDVNHIIDEIKEHFGVEE
jgi:hypothetical protein